MEQDSTHTSALDLFIIWVGTIASHITSSDLMVWATFNLTVIPQPQQCCPPPAAEVV
jgi:hypothetical protein